MRAVYTWAALAAVVGAGGLSARGHEKAPSGGFGAEPIQVDEVKDFQRVQILAPEVGWKSVKPGAAGKSTYLGVATSPAQPALQKQLQLKAGVGLVVDSVDGGSPAKKAGVKEFDVLHKLDNQLLINTDQLAVLIRSYKPETEVQLTVIREGVPQTLPIKLGEHEARQFMTAFPGQPGITYVRQPRNVFELVNGNVVVTTPDKKQQITAERLTIENDRHKMTVNGAKGRKHLKVEDKAGKTLFEGPIDTAENLDKVPADLRKAYEELLGKASVIVPAVPGTTVPGIEPATAPVPEGEGSNPAK